jgi:hypothetical protein
MFVCTLNNTHLKLHIQVLLQCLRLTFQKESYSKRAIARAKAGLRFAETCPGGVGFHRQSLLTGRCSPTGRRAVLAGRGQMANRRGPLHLGFRLTWLRSRCRFLWRWRFTRLAVGSCACSGGHAAQKPDGVRIHTRTQTSASCRPMGTRMGVGASMPKLGSGLTPLRAQVHRSGSRLSLSRCRCRCRLAVTGVRISSCGSYFSPVGGTRFLRRR